ncbi:hypothetical protein NIES4071_63770 [Calothrix sp. NIES-4071]|nr:hypothetical protein NIES4071_63770 [Calothrix sp. NIES-4071]BAZ60681.1 hypothetical protein NIES4105_63730 [Calothrix sp. NIES-4105]
MKTSLIKIITIFSVSLGGIGLVGGGFFLSRALDKSEANQIVKDTGRYQEVRSKLWLNQAQIKHFPTQIPVDATGVRFVYSPGYMQGGNVLQLRMKQPQSKIATLATQYRQAAKYKFRGGNTNEHINKPNGVPTTFFHTSDDTTDNTFPFEYEILVLGADDKGRKDFQWNHGDSYGVAINPQASEIIYWAEAW